VSLQLLGGRVRGVTQAAVGEQALRVLDTLRVDIAFIGTNAISPRHGLSTPDGEEAAVKRAMVRCANYVVVVADSTKVGREDLVSFAPITSVDTLITDAEIADADRKSFAEEGVEVITAGVPS
jgi:DeoR family fructose operon transcriptional repressor